jgi:hypothetical protein
VNSRSLLQFVRRQVKWHADRRSRRRIANCGRLELLEDRCLLSDFYDLSTVASTAGGTFSSIGNLVSTNNVGDVAFVAQTGSDGETTGSGLWLSRVVGGLTNVNPGFANNPTRDFGSAAEITNTDIVLARDHVAGAPGVYDLRTWQPGTPNDYVVRASANNDLQPDFGKYSALQTYADINENGDIAFVALSSDGLSRLLMYQAKGADKAIEVYSFPVETPVSRPQLTTGGRILVTNGHVLVLVNPLNNQFDVVARGFTEMGYSSGMSDNGSVVTFIGNRGNGRGVFIAYKTASGYKVEPIAGDGENGWTNDSFNLSDAVRVNNTLVSQHGVTVAFEASHVETGHGIYSVRVSFFGANAAADFSTSKPTSMSASGAVPVLTDLDQYQGQVVNDVQLWNGVDDVGRGEIVFWAQTADSQQHVIRAISTPVIWIDFTPLTSPNPASSAIQNLLLLQQVGVQGTSGLTNLDQALLSSGISPSTNFIQLETQIVSQVQQYYKNAGTKVQVLGKLGDVRPDFVPLSTADLTPGGGVTTVDHGAYMTIQVGGAPTAAPQNLFGQASGPFITPNGTTTLDYFNQTQDDLGVVFADHILTFIGASSSGTDLATAIARIIAHETGHNFGLVHLDTTSNQDVMNARIETRGELTTAGSFRDVSVSSAAMPNITEDSVRRLWFAVGGPSPGATPSQAFLTSNQGSLYSLAPAITTQVVVHDLLVGLSDGDDTIPTFMDLGGGNLADVLAKARINFSNGDKWILLGSTDGTNLDIVGAAPGAEATLANLDLSQLGLTTNPNLQATIGGSSVLNVFQLTDQGAMAIGSATVQGVPTAAIVIDDNTVDSGANLGLGVLIPGSGAIVKTVTVQNNGSGNLVLGTVAISGAGYSVTQPGQSTLAPGESTDVTVTLSDTTPGSVLTGTLTIPDNDPNGNFSLVFQAAVNNNPRVLSVSRIDNGTGPVKVEIDFSGQLQPTPAGVSANFTIASDSGISLIPVSAIYSESSGKGRVVLTTSVNAADLAAGNYTVRFDGSKVLALNGAPLATSQSQLLVANYGDQTISTLGNGPDGLGVISGPDRTGFGAPTQIAVADLNEDGISDIVALSTSTGELVLQFGLTEGGYAAPTSILLDRPEPTLLASPQSILTADWNGDGFTDLMVYDAVSDYYLGQFNRIFIFLNDGHGNFSAAPDSPIPVSADAQGPLLAIGDFTGDGLLDIAIGGPLAGNDTVGYTNSVAIYGKDPFLGYSQTAVIPLGGNFPVAAIMADLNHDGWQDLVLDTSGLTSVNFVLLGTPSGLGQPQTLSYDGEGGLAAVGDFNGDNKLDIAIMNDNYSNFNDVHDGDIISLLLGDGAGNFTAQPNQILNRRGSSLVGVADLNGDGKLDLLLRADPFDQPGYDPTPELSAWVLLGDGEGGFRPQPLVPLAPSGDIAPANFVVTDVTGDGLPDVLFGNNQSGQMGLLTNDGTGTFTCTEPAGPLQASVAAFVDYTLPGETGVVVADLNRDGLPDEIRLVGGVGISGQQGIDLFLGASGGGFNIAASLPVTQYDQTPGNQYVGDLQWIRVGDINNDGWPDILVGGNGGAMEILLGVDGTRFIPAVIPLVDAGTSGAVVTGNLVDVNRDGNLDFVALLSGNATQLGVFFGDGTGKLQFNANTVLGLTGSDQGAPLVADVTGDGKPDLVVGTLDEGTNSSSKLTTYIGQGNGKFILGPILNRDSTDTGTRLVASDFNGDGFTDILSVDSDGDLSFYYGNGTGHFTSAPDQTITLHVNHDNDNIGGYLNVGNIVIGDFTQDGFPDIALTIQSGSTFITISTVILLPGDGTGHFGPEQEIPSGGQSPLSLAQVPIAGTITAGTFSVALPVFSIPLGAIDLTANTFENQAVVVNPRPLLDSLSNAQLVLAIGSQPSHGTVAISPNGTPGDLTDDVLAYAPARDYFGSDSFTYQVADGNGGLATGTVTVSIARAGSLPPVLTTSAGPTEFIEGADPVPVDSGISLTDSDSRDLNGGRLTVSFASGAISSDQLIIQFTYVTDGLIDVNGTNVLFNGDVIGTWAGGTDGTTPLVITLNSAFATPTAIQGLAQSIAYSSTSHDPGSTDRIVRYIVADGDSGISQVALKTITVTPINSSPVLQTFFGYYFEDYTQGTPPFVVAADTTVSDLDSPVFSGGDLTISITSGNSAGDRLTIRNQGAGSANISLNGANVLFGANVIGTWTGGSNGSTPLVIHFTSAFATPLAVQALARNILFSNMETDTGYGDRYLEFVVSDGAGGSSDPDSVYFTVSQNPSPVLTTSPGTTAYTAGTTPVVIDPGLVITDPVYVEFALGNLTVSFVSGGTATDLVAIRNQGTGTGEFSVDGTSVLFEGNEIGTWTGGTNGSSPLAITFFGGPNIPPEVVQALARNIVFSNSSPNPSLVPRVLQFTTENYGGYTSASMTKTVSVSISPNVAPVLTTSAGSASYSASAQAVVVDAAVAVSDPDSPNFNGGNLTLSFAAGGTASDRLAIQIQGAGTGNISLNGTNVLFNGNDIGTWTGGTDGLTPLVITFNSSFATPDAIQGLARSIVYSNTSNDPGSADRVVRFIVADGDSGVSQVALKTIKITPVSSSPVLTTTGLLDDYAQGTPPFILAADITVSDSDSPAFSGGNLTISITSGNSAGDRLVIRNQGTGAGDISLNGANVLFGGNVIGTWTGGSNGSTPLVISFNSAFATPVAAQALARSILFSNVDTDTGYGDRELEFVVSDGAGGSSDPALLSFTVIIPLNTAPVLTTSAGSTGYSAGASAVVVDSAVVVSDTDSPNFNGGNLTLSFATGGTASDHLVIRNQGTGAGNISLNGANVLFGSNVIGIWTGGTDGSTPLVITFNSTFATPAAVQALARNIVFSSTNLSAGGRVIQFTVADGDGGVSPAATKAVTITTGPNVAPIVSTSAGTDVYDVLLAKIVVDQNVTVTDSDSPDFNGGMLTVSFQSGASSASILAIRNAGNAAGQINLSGTTVNWGAIPIGTFSGGFTSNSALVISLTSGATPDAVQELARNITFQINSNGPATNDRVVQFALTDGDGGTSTPVTKTVVVNFPNLNHAPTVTLPTSNVTYSKFAVPVAIDGQAVVTDPDTGTGKLGGGTLAISINIVNTGKFQRDVFETSALNVIGVSQGTQTVNGRKVVTFKLNDSVTALEVQNALRELKFSTSKTGMKFTTRTVQVELIDSAGASSGVVSKTVNVSKKRVKVLKSL